MVYLSVNGIAKRRMFNDRFLQEERAIYKVLLPALVPSSSLPPPLQILLILALTDFASEVDIMTFHMASQERANSSVVGSSG